MRATRRAGQGNREKVEQRPFNDGSDDEGHAPRGLPHPSCCVALLLSSRAGIYSQEDIGKLELPISISATFSHSKWESWGAHFDLKILV